jgi:hypothetical protein
MMLRGIVTTIVLTAALLPAASAPATAATKPPPPKVGACYNYTNKQSAAASSPTRAVSCAGRHTAVTYFVGTVTGTPARSTSPTSAAVVAQEGRACQLRWVSLMGARIGMSRANFTYFTPTVAQWKAGARWFRCDGVANALNALVTIPANFLTFARSAAGITAYKRCLTSTHLVTACSATHALMVKTYVVLGTATARFPGASALLTRTSTLCDAASPTPAVVWVTYPLAVGWAAGARTGDCYVTG